MVSEAGGEQGIAQPHPDNPCFSSLRAVWRAARGDKRQRQVMLISTISGTKASLLHPPQILQGSVRGPLGLGSLRRAAQEAGCARKP